MNSKHFGPTKKLIAPGNNNFLSTFELIASRIPTNEILAMYTSCLLSDSKVPLFCPAANSKPAILPVFHSPPFTLPNMYRDKRLLLKVSVTD
jgi:hypothetical protein